MGLTGFNRARREAEEAAKKNASADVGTDEGAADQAYLKKLNKAELVDLAKEKNIDIPKKATKADIIELIVSADVGTDE